MASFQPDLLLPRSVTSEVEVPRTRSRDGNGSINFSSKLIPPYLRRSKSIDALAAYAYLKGVSERDMAQVLRVVQGARAKKPLAEDPNRFGDVHALGLDETLFYRQDRYRT